MSSKHATLSRRERQIMDIIYQRGKATAAEVMEGLPDPPSYSAVRALLRVLGRSGCRPALTAQQEAPSAKHQEEHRRGLRQNRDRTDGDVETLDRGGSRCVGAQEARRSTGSTNLSPKLQLIGSRTQHTISLIAIAVPELAVPAKTGVGGPAPVDVRLQVTRGDPSSKSPRTVYVPETQ